MRLSRYLFLVTSMLAATALQANTPPSADMQEYRTHMFDEPVRVLANRTIALMFNTAPVETGDTLRELPARPAALDFSYTANGVVHPASDVIANTFADGLLIITRGAIVYEGYFNRADAQTHFNSYSMAKSLNAVMIGLALRQGLIGSVDDLVTDYIPELAGTGYAGVTVRNLMEMRSGIAWDENFMRPGTSSYNAHVASWVSEQQRYTDAALTTAREHAPGSFFRYNSLDAGVAGWVVERAAGKPVAAFLSENLWAQAGMERDAFYVIDGPPGIGREFTAGGFNAVLRDYGRLGLLMLEGGMAGDRALFPAGFVDRLASDTSGQTGDNLGYGWFWWTDPQSTAFTALGGEGQYIYIDPATQTVIVKMSHGPVGPEAVPVRAQEIAFMRAASAWAGGLSSE